MLLRGFLGAFDCCWMLRQWAAGDLSPRSCPPRRRYKGFVNMIEGQGMRDKDDAQGLRNKGLVTTIQGQWLRDKGLETSV
jgi:hypothetical protein